MTIIGSVSIESIQLRMCLTRGRVYEQRGQLANSFSSLVCFFSGFFSALGLSEPVLDFPSVVPLAERVMNLK